MVELSTRRFGEAVARLRTKREWSRAKLIARLLDEIDQDDPDYGSISETWLSRLENGKMVKLTRGTVEAVSTALGCSTDEKAHLLLCADRNVLVRGDDKQRIAREMLNHYFLQIRDDALKILTELVDDRRAHMLTAHEKEEATGTALEMVIRELRNRRTP